MHRVSCVQLLALAACLGIAASIPVQHCDPDYECSFTFRDLSGIVWEYDFAPLCSSANDYSITDPSNHTYYFNVCGVAHKRCLPDWRNTYQFGVAVQMWGDAPPCDLPAANATNYCIDPESKQKVCCTAPCQVLGVGIPIWKPLDENDPLGGGVTITHAGVPPSSDDPFNCPYNTKTGQQADRMITYNLLCDPAGTPGNPTVIGVAENVTHACHYSITLKAKEACGCSPDCIDSNCGDSGCRDQKCGKLNGGCPSGFACDSNRICCKPDCGGRNCGGDGCGGYCGPLNGDCPKDQYCMRDQQCGYAGQLPGGPVKKTSAGSITGAFFGGLFTAVALGGVGFFVYKRRSGSYSFSGGGTSYGAGSGSAAVTSTPTATLTSYNAE